MVPFYTVLAYYLTFLSLETYDEPYYKFAFTVGSLSWYVLFVWMAPIVIRIVDPTWEGPLYYVPILKWLGFDDRDIEEDESLATEEDCFDDETGLTKD